MGSVYKISKHRFSRVVVLQNKASTNAERSQKFIDELQRMFDGKRVFVSDITGFNAQKIQKTIEDESRHLGPKTLIAVGGGDGTLSSVIQAITTSTALSRDNRKAVIFPLWGGNANDLAVMLNGVVSAKSLQKTLESAGIVEVYPLRLFIESPDAKYTKIATCYASFGATAQASWVMERSSHVRGSKGPKYLIERLIKELIDMARTVISVGTFGIVGDDDQVVHMYERIFINGSRIARIPNRVVKLTDKKYLEASMKKKSFYSFFVFFRGFYRKNHGMVTNETRKFIVKDATMAQIDGEIIGLEADTSVEVGIHDTPFYALSRKLQ